MAFIYDLADTWNDAGTVFNGIKLNVTDTASDADSLLMDLQVGGTSKLSVKKDGRLIAAALTSQSLIDANARMILTAAFGYLRIQGNSNSTIEWSESSSVYSTKDLILTRDAAGTLAQRNSTNAQTFNLYNTYTDGSNYERGFMKWNSNVLEIGTEAAGTGTARNIKLLAGTGELNLSTTGQLNVPANGNHQIGSGTSNTELFVSSRSSIGYDGSGAFVEAGASKDFGIRINGSVLLCTSVGSVQIAKGLTVATLPGTPLVGMMARVTDGDSGLTFGNTVVNSGAGATPYLVWYNGTNWTVIGA